MEIGVISVRYARALLKSATQAKVEDGVYQEMRCLADSYLHVGQLKQAIDNPMIPKDKKLSLLFSACGEASDLSRRFITLVLNEGRGALLQFIAASYVTLYVKQKNIINGKLITATPVDSETELKMKKMVESRTNGTVEFETEINPDILGGFILEYDTYRMDASVKTKLNEILSELKK